MADLVNYNNISIEQDLVCDTSTPGLMCCDDKKKLDTVAEGANKYVHPDTHSANIITENINRRFVSDTEKSTWNAKANASHGTHVTYATIVGKAPGTAAVGTSAKVAREDHDHPLQTSVSGSSGSCTGNAATASFADEAGIARNATTANFADTAHTIIDSNDSSINVTFAPSKDSVTTAPSFAVWYESGSGPELRTMTPSSVRSVIGAASTSVASTSANGLMSKTDKTKLDAVPKITSGNTLPSSGAEDDIFFLLGSEKQWPEIVTNANGTAVKWESGFMLCYSTKNFNITSWTAWGSLFASPVINMGNTPATFKEAPHVWTMAVSTTNSVANIPEYVYGASTTSYGNIEVARPTDPGTNRTITLNIFAIGRWK